MTGRSESIDPRLVYWTRWCFDTCVLYGCSPDVAGHVAGHFAAALKQPGIKDEEC